jgi:myo-inositol-1(or 4)-monophosphatase
MPLPELEELRAVVTAAAHDEALAGFTRVTRQFKWDGSVVTEIDHRLQARISQALRERWPGLPLLGEEMTPEQQQRLLTSSADGLWVLDPLDGTTNFASGLPFFSVSLALLRNGKVELGLIYDPVRDECFTARRGGGAALNDEPLSTSPDLELRRTIACVDFKRLPGHLADQLAHAFPYMSQRNIGSSCLDWCWLAAGRFQVYIHGGQKLWDYAAGSLILLEAGGAAQTLEGEPVYAHELVPRSVVAASNPGLFEQWRAWIEANK